MELQDLYNKFISEGCNRFYIEGLGPAQSDDVECFGFNNGKWEVYYIERGQKGEILFSSENKQAAIQFYHDYVLSIEHWHIVAFTRSNEILERYKHDLEKLNVRTIQNDIPSYKTVGDRVYRLFVTNKDIFIARENLEVVPFYDDNLKR